MANSQIPHQGHLVQAEDFQWMVLWALEDRKREDGDVGIQPGGQPVTAIPVKESQHHTTHH
jgi:hypothetical protein